jgi:hypothetical protein
VTSGETVLGVEARAAGEGWVAAEDATIWPLPEPRAPVTWGTAGDHAACNRWITRLDAVIAEKDNEIAMLRSRLSVLEGNHAR